MPQPCGSSLSSAPTVFGGISGPGTNLGLPRGRVFASGSQEQSGSLWRQGGQRRPLIRSGSGPYTASSPSCLFADGRSTKPAFTAPCLA